ncbi:MAG: hypothetical protein AAGF12_12710, partial [Myxococcota bacterium]
LELMAVVIIIAITVAVAGPAISDAMAIRRAGEAPVDVITMARRARAEAVSTGRAHLVRFTTADDGTFEAYRAVNNSCRGTDWAVITAAGACGTAASMCIQRIAMSEGVYDMDSTDILVTSTGGQALVDICYQPNGETWWRTTAGGTFVNTNPGGGGFVFQFQRRDDGVAVGVTRRASFPIGADPRVQTL